MQFSRNQAYKAVVSIDQCAESAPAADFTDAAFALHEAAEIEARLRREADERLRRRQLVQEMRGRNDWRQIRCQTCHGLGTVARGAVLTWLDESTANAEDYGDVLCRDCGGYGVTDAVFAAQEAHS